VSAAPQGRDFEWAIGRLLIVMTYVAVALLIVGVVLMLAAGTSPLSGGPAFHLADVVPDILALRPEGFIWLGLLVVLSSPIVRVVVAGFGYGRDREWPMVGVAIGILVVIAVAIITASITEV
jgi:uncharacterized membrane protein